MKTDWYQKAVVYQIYPFSFKDSNNDGWGDIEGILSKLDYIQNLGVSAIWFSPLYVSPDYDYGYDIADYYNIDAKFGTMEDFRRLLKECHERGLKVIMDMVMNHTSTEHPWFLDALNDPDSKYRDYYIIRPGIRKKGKLFPPNNWASTFTGSAWERMGDSDDFYLHLFCKEQADLNWENPEVRKEMAKILNYWLEMGVDGFRFDVFNMYSKVYPLQDDNDRKSFQKGAKYFVDGPRMHEFLKELTANSMANYDCFSVGESYHPSEENAVEYVRKDNEELNAIFNFAHLDSDNIGGAKFFKKPFDLLQFKSGLFDPQKKLYGIGWNTLVLENHDNPRAVCRFSIDYRHYRYEAATMLAMITYCGSGTSFIYMGQEIGAVNTDFRSIDDMKDPVSHFVYDLLCHYGVPKKLALHFIKYGARDHARVPMAWDDSVNGGFNKGTSPWQCVNPLYKEINVEKDLNSEKSVYRFYQKLLALRAKEDTLIFGTTEEIDHENKKVVAYKRAGEDKTFYLIANFSKSFLSYRLPKEAKGAEVVLDNYDSYKTAGDNLELKPYQAVLLCVNDEKE